METPLSSRRVTRSQTAITNNNTTIPLSGKMDDSEKSVSKSRNGKQQRDRALIDITNDSPIVGLATGNMKTPLSSMGKQRSHGVNRTPGSGEALLRGQVKNLLQKVEEDTELPKLDNSRPVFQLKGFVNSPAGLLAPTPANTPQISNISGTETVKDSGLATITSFLGVQYQSMNGDRINWKKEESLECEKDMITRSLLFDFSEKSESIDLSEVTYQGTTGLNKCEEKQSVNDDDADSIWSIQVNASSTHDEDVEEFIDGDEEDEEEYYYGEEEEEKEDGGLVDALCEGISNMNMNGSKIAKFEGKHMRFVYNSDDENIIEGEEECADSVFSPSVLRLKGLPTPKGKHLRFALADEETDK